MRRFLACLLVFALLLIPGAVLSESDPTAFAAEAMASLVEKNGKWYGWILNNAGITAEAAEENWVVTVTLVDPAAPDGASTLTEALSTLNQAGTVVETDVVSKDGAFAWGKKRNLRTIESAVKKITAAAKKSYETKAFRQIIHSAVIPAENAASSAVAKALGLEGDTVNQRFALLSRMTEVVGLDATNGPDAVTVTLRTRDWSSLLKKANKAARETMKQTTGIPAMTRDEIDSILCDAMLDLVADYEELQKGSSKVKVRCNLPAVADGTLTADDPMAAKIGELLTEMDSQTDDLMAYASTLSFYPSIRQPDTGFLDGSEQADGTLVSFRNSSAESSTYIRVIDQGREIFRGFVYRGDRLYAHLTPGTYEVRMAQGAAWYGERYLFGDNTVCSSFELTVPQAEALSVTLGGEGITGSPIDEQYVAIIP